MRQGMGDVGPGRQVDGCSARDDDVRTGYDRRG